MNTNTNTQPVIGLPYESDSMTLASLVQTLPGFIFFNSGSPTHERGRYDIFTAAPLFTLTYDNTTLYTDDENPQNLSGPQLTQYLNQQLSTQQEKAQQAKNQAINEQKPKLPFNGGFAGYFSYDIGRVWETLPNTAEDDLHLPTMQLGFYTWACVIDHQTQQSRLSFLPQCPADLQKKITRLLINKETSRHKKIDNNFNIINELEAKVNLNSYSRSIATIQDYIHQGDCYQANFAQRFSGQYQGSAWQAYQQLCPIMQAPFGSYIDLNAGSSTSGNAILSFSPERFLEVRGGNVVSQPIKGTAPRHSNPQTDHTIANQLANSEKDRAENLMIVDLIRNDLGKCCQYGSVKTEKLFELQSFSNVHHLVSTVTGQLKTNTTPFDLLQTTLPGGSITGAPKIRAMEIIEELEPQRRSIYCGVVAYIDISGDMDSNIAIRTVLCKDEKIHCWGGGGIVADSEWQEEYQESLDKIEPILHWLNRTLK